MCLYVFVRESSGEERNVGSAERGANSTNKMYFYFIVRSSYYSLTLFFLYKLNNEIIETNKFHKNKTPFFERINKLFHSRFVSRRNGIFLVED